MKTQKLFSALLALAALVACAPPNKKLESAPEAPAAHSFKADLKSETTSEVDILFVVDNSRSMIDEQNTLQENIEQFVKALQAMNTNYHIGIVTTHDSNRIQPGKKNYWANGRLRPLTLPGQAAVSIPHPKAEGGGSCTTTDAIAGNGNKKSGFITPQTKDGLAVLRASLKVGVLCLEDGGPEQEELFSPALAAVSAKLTNKGQPNEGFYRDSAHLAVVIVSDATPSDKMTAEDFVNELRALKGNNPKLLSVHVIGVTAKDVQKSKADKEKRARGIAVSDECRVDFGLEKDGNESAMDMVVNAGVGHKNGEFLRLCSKNWGKELTNISTEIKRRLHGKIVRIPHPFEFIERGTFKVSVNGKQMPSGPKTWTRDTRSNSIVFSDEVDLGANNDAEVEISYRTLTPANARRAQNGI